MLILFTDTDTDITPEMAKEFDYHLISMPYSIGDKTTYPYVDFDKFEAHPFYESLRNGTLPTTSALNPDEYVRYFEPFLAKGDDILYVHFSKRMSGTFNSLNLALNELKEKYPDRKVYLIDTKGITIGSLNIVLEIGELYKAGKSIEEIQKWAEVEVDKFAIYFFADDLKFFARSGRVSGIAGFMGNIFGVKPIIYMGSDGVMTNIGKEKGRKNAVAKLVNYVVELGEDVKNHRIIVAHADAPKIVEDIIKLLKEKLGEDLNIVVVDVNPTAGSHCGPDSVGISFHAIHR
ncbi:MAG: DegV family protein [Bacilli bacterium]|nr:DegV family protein [Bacilli bacterium]